MFSLAHLDAIRTAEIDKIALVLSRPARASSRSAPVPASRRSICNGAASTSPRSRSRIPTTRRTGSFRSRTTTAGPIPLPDRQHRPGVFVERARACAGSRAHARRVPPRAGAGRLLLHPRAPDPLLAALDHADLLSGGGLVFRVLAAAAPAARGAARRRAATIAGRMVPHRPPYRRSLPPPAARRARQCRLRAVVVSPALVATKFLRSRLRHRP